jgi:hypothetical protein
MMELSAGVLYIGVCATARGESRNREFECQNQIPSLSFLQDEMAATNTHRVLCTMPAAWPKDDWSV